MYLLVDEDHALGDDEGAAGGAHEVGGFGAEDLAEDVAGFAAGEVHLLEAGGGFFGAVTGGGGAETDVVCAFDGHSSIWDCGFRFRRRQGPG